MNSSQIRRRFFLYTVLQTFTQNLFFTFGALLIFSKTHAILGVLLFNLLGDVTAVSIKSWGFENILGMIRRFGFIKIMAAGLFLNTACLIAIFSLDGKAPLFYLWLLILAVLGNAGSSVYNVSGTTLELEVIGDSEVPGFSAAQIDVLNISSGLLAVVVGVTLSHYGVFSYAFLAGALMLLISVVPLFGIPDPETPLVSFRENIKKIPKAMLWANFNPDHELSVTAIPLVILLLSASLKLSVNINAVIAVFSILLAYSAGALKDRGKTWLVWLMLAASALSWTAFGFVRTPIGFILPTICVGLAMGVITLYRESKMGPDIRGSGNLLGATFAIEFMRSLGSLTGTILILIAYLLFRTIPKQFLILGWLFLIPLSIYSARKDRKPPLNGQKFNAIMQ